MVIRPITIPHYAAMHTIMKRKWKGDTRISLMDAGGRGASGPAPTPPLPSALAADPLLLMVTLAALSSVDVVSWTRARRAASGKRLSTPVSGEIETVAVV